MKILIGIPTYDRRLDIELVRCLIDLERNKKFELDYVFPVSSHLSRNRNYCCKQFLAGDYNALLFLDSDIGITDPEFLSKMIDTAYRLDAQVVGGAYLMKKLNETIYIAGNKVSEKYDNIRKRPEKPEIVNAVGTGIMLIFRQVLEKMPEPWFTIVDGKDLFVMPEDFEFCRKAEELGYKIAIEPRFDTNHYGLYSWHHAV